jgi:hypothetical protein
MLSSLQVNLGERNKQMVVEGRMDRADNESVRIEERNLFRES